MTAEPDLLPLPEKWTAYAFMTQGVMMDMLHAYARACVAHATAAKDAEVEALRAEVRKVCADHKQACSDYESLQEILGGKLTNAEARAALEQENGRG